MIRAAAGQSKRLDHAHGLRVAEMELVDALGHHDGEFAVGRVVHVVRIFDRDGLAVNSGGGVDLGKAVAKVVEHPQRLQIVGRRDVLGLAANGKMPNNAISFRIDNVDRITAAVGNINERRKLAHHGAELAGGVSGIDIQFVQNRRHSRQRSIDHGWIGEQKQHELAEHEPYVQAIKFTKTGKATITHFASWSAIASMLSRVWSPPGRRCERRPCGSTRNACG